MIGYGYGLTKQEARYKSFDHLRNQLGVSVHSTHVFSEFERITNIGIDEFSDTRAAEVIINADIHGAVLRKAEQRGSYYFIAYSTDIRSVRSRILETPSLCQGAKAVGIRRQQSLTGFKSFAPITRDLQADGCPDNWTLQRLNNSWSIELAGHSFQLPNGQLWRLTLAIDKTDELTLLDDKHHEQESFRAGERYFVSYNKPVNSNMYLFLVNELGQVNLLDQSEAKQLRRERWLYPNPDKYAGGLIAAPNSSGSIHNDLIVAAACPETIHYHFSSLTSAKPDLADERLYVLDRLIKEVEHCLVHMRSLRIVL